MINLLKLYVQLIGLALIGFMLGRKLPHTVPTYLGQLLFWVGAPITVVAFLRQADLSAQIWLAPVICYLAIFLGAFLAWIAIKGQAYFTNREPEPGTQGSLILAAMLGNTGYLGFPVILAIVGKEYFAWALFYDLLGSVFGAYGLGVALATRFSNSASNYWQISQAVLINPTLWSLGFGLWFRQVPLPTLIEFCLDKLAWTGVALSLVLIGMRLSRLRSWQSLPQAGMSLAIKMLLVPLLLGSTLPFFGITGVAAQVMILQMAMPPAFATLVIAESFGLDRDLAVTALAAGAIILLLTLPVWVWVF